MPGIGPRRVVLRGMRSAGAARWTAYRAIKFWADVLGATKMSDAYLLIQPPKPSPIARVEVCRSFAYKHNAGNYESRDFFCSEKAECSIEDAAEVSAALYAFCRNQVFLAVKEYLSEAKRQRDQLGSDLTVQRRA